MLTLNSITFKTESQEDTIKLGRLFGLLLKGDETICLDGEIASGKTTFTKGIAQALNIKDTIKSPTFTICKEYTGKFDLFHLDLYRMEGLGINYDLQEFLGSGVTCIEWANNAPEILPLNYSLVSFKIISEEVRLITISNFSKYKELVYAISRS